jgi:hypothetical protein
MPRLHGRLVDGIGAPHGEGAPKVILIQWITWPVFGMHPCFAGCTLLGSTRVRRVDSDGLTLHGAASRGRSAHRVMACDHVCTYS